MLLLRRERSTSLRMLPEDRRSSLFRPAFMVAAAARECECGGVCAMGEADGECDCDMLRGSVMEGRRCARWRGEEGAGEGGRELRSGGMAWAV